MSDVQLLSVPEVAQRLSYTREHVYRLIRSGQLRAVRLHEGAHWRVPVEALDDLIARGWTPTSLDAAAHSDRGPYRWEVLRGGADMVEYRMVDFRTPRLGGVEDRGDLEGLERELREESEQGWRVHQVIGGLDDERLLFLFERTLAD